MFGNLLLIGDLIDWKFCPSVSQLEHYFDRNLYWQKEKLENILGTFNVDMQTSG